MRRARIVNQVKSPRILVSFSYNCSNDSRVGCFSISVFFTRQGEYQGIGRFQFVGLVFFNIQKCLFNALTNVGIIFFIISNVYIQISQFL